MNGNGALSPSVSPLLLPPSLATKTTTSTAATSCMNRVLSSMTLIALGAMGGFGIFHSALHYRIERTELTHNATLAIVTNRCFESEQECNRCLETDDGRSQELSDLRGRLDAQHKNWYDLTAAQRSMVSKQKDTTAQMQRFREVYETDQQALASLKATSEQKDRNLITVQEDYRRTKAELESELTKVREAKEGETLDLQAQMKNKGLELESLLENLNHLSDHMEQLKRERDDLQTRIRQQDEELESTKKNSDTLQNRKRRLEDDVLEQKEMIQELLQESERVREELRESKEWIVGATQKIEDHKSDQAESEKLISEKMNESNDLKVHIDSNQKSANEEISKLELDLAETRKTVQEKTNQIEHLKRLNSDLQEIVMDVNDLKSNDNIPLGSTTSEKMMIDHVQQRDGVICRQLFGKGPYYVKFVIRLPPGDGDGEDNTNTMFFVIELSSRKELPHSTYTFLTLVESNLYNDGVSFLSAGDDGSSLKIESSHSPDVIRLEQKLKPLGLTGGSSLSFVEPTTSGEALPCGKHSFGFVHRGPGLNLFLSSDNETTDCFAHVIRGQEDLQKIKSILLENREPLEIISAKHLRVD